MRWLRLKLWLVDKLGGETEYLEETLYDLQNDRNSGLRMFLDYGRRDIVDTSQFKTMLNKLPPTGSMPSLHLWDEDAFMPRMANQPVTFEWDWKRAPEFSA